MPTEWEKQRNRQSSATNLVLQPRSCLCDLAGSAEQETVRGCARGPPMLGGLRTLLGFGAGIWIQTRSVEQRDTDRCRV